LKRAAELGERGLGTVAGRRNTVRAARFLLGRTRFDGTNSIKTNGVFARAAMTWWGP
jgi:hypothetical protein